MFVVTSGVIRQNISLVMQSGVNIFGESAQEPIYYFISYMIFGCWNTGKSMKTPIDRPPLHYFGIVTSRKNLLWRHFDRLSWERFQVGHARLPTVVELSLVNYRELFTAFSLAGM